MGRFGFGAWPAARRRAGSVPPVLPPVILAVLAGQSNSEGRTAREAQDVDVARAVQFVGESSAGNYRTLTADITPLLHFATLGDNGGTAVLGPGEYLARQLLADNPGADVVLVPCGRGSTAMATAGDPWYPAAAGGGALFENMVAQANLAHAAAQARFPGRPIVVRIVFVQGEQDASNGVGTAVYRASLGDWIAHARARITGAAGAIVVLGSMVPEKWRTPGQPGYDVSAYDAGYAAINAAHVDASLTIAGVRYAVGPAYSAASDLGQLYDRVHYKPQQRTREQGLRHGAILSDAVGPVMTSAGAYPNTAGTKLSFALSGSDEHQTFHIDGGADAALFEISDAYLNPKLRWVGDGTGPALGEYAVGVRARDGAGNFGTTQTIALTVAAVGAISPASFFMAGERGAVWDLSDPAALFQDVAGTTPVSAAGQPVGRVLDRSGNGNHWTAAANDGTRPTYRIDGNGQPYLEFDGTDDALYAAQPFITATRIDHSASLGIRGGAQGKDVPLLCTGTVADNGSYAAYAPFFVAGGSTALTANSGGGAAPSLSGSLDGTTRVVTHRQAAAGDFGFGANKLRDAAARPAGGGAGGYAGPDDQGYFVQSFADVNRAMLGALRLTHPGLQFLNAWFAGRIYSGFVIARTLSDAEIKAGEDWVAARAGVTLP